MSLTCIFFFFPTPSGQITLGQSRCRLIVIWRSALKNTCSWVTSRFIVFFAYTLGKDKAESEQPEKRLQWEKEKPETTEGKKDGPPSPFCTLLTVLSVKQPSLNVHLKLPNWLFFLIFLLNQFSLKPFRYSLSPAEQHTVAISLYLCSYFAAKPELRNGKHCAIC